MRTAAAAAALRHLVLAAGLAVVLLWSMSAGAPTEPPIWIWIDPGVDPAWQVPAAVEEWNQITGCQLFTLEPGVSTVVVEVRQIVDPAVRWWGETRRDAGVIDLNAVGGTPEIVPMHELGHLLGLEHDHQPGGLMDVDVDADGLYQYASAVPDQTEVAEVWAMQQERCGA